MVQDTIPYMHHALTKAKKHVLVEGGKHIPIWSGHISFHSKRGSP